MTLTRGSNKTKKTEEGRSFSVQGDEGKAVKFFLAETKQYITVHELRTPAKVVDKLRRDFLDLSGYNRASMKMGVRKILNLQEVVVSVNAHWGVVEPRDELDEDHVVSTTRAER